MNTVDSPHWYSSDVVESENDQHVVNSPSYPEALLVHHLKKLKVDKEKDEKFEKLARNCLQIKSRMQNE